MLTPSAGYRATNERKIGSKFITYTQAAQEQHPQIKIMIQRTEFNKYTVENGIAMKEKKVILPKALGK